MFGLGTVTREKLIARQARAVAASGAVETQIGELEARHADLAGRVLDDDAGDIRRDVGGVLEDLAKARAMRETMGSAVAQATAALEAFDREAELQERRRVRAAIAGLVEERAGIAAELEAKVEELGETIIRLRENADKFWKIVPLNMQARGGLQPLTDPETRQRILAWLAHRLPEWLAPDNPGHRVHFAAAATYVLAERRYSAHLIPPDPDAPAAAPEPAASAPGGIENVYHSPE